HRRGVGEVRSAVERVLDPGDAGAALVGGGDGDPGVADVGAVGVPGALDVHPRHRRCGVLRGSGDDRELHAPDGGDVARPVGGAVADGVGADPVHHDRPGVRLPGAVADRVLDGVDAGTGVRGGHRHGRHVDIGAVVVAFAV